MHFSDMTLKHRVLAVSGALLVVIAVVVAVSIRATNQIESKAAVFTQREVAASELLLNIDRDAYQAQKAVSDFVNAPDDDARAAALADFQENAQQTRTRWEEYTQLSARHPGETENWESFASAREDWVASAEELMSAETVDEFENLLGSYPIVSERFDVMRAQIDTLSADIYEPIINGFHGEVQAVGDSTNRTLYVLLALSLLIGTVLAWMTARSVSVRVAESADRVTGSSVTLSEVSSEMLATAESTASQANVVAAAGEQVSHNVQTVATAVEEMSASVREIASSSAEASKVAADAVRSAESTNANVSKLGESSAEIGKVIEVITSIAEQTNLLALNATIEAARAGEAGKGFAVVANEVKELAKETAKATEEISSKIAAIQTDTGSAVDSIGEISSIIARISDMQTTIASAVEEQTATTNEIGRNVNEAARGSAEIAENIVSVAQAAQETSEGASRTQRSAGDLAGVADGLQALVGTKRDRRGGGSSPMPATSTDPVPAGA